MLPTAQFVTIIVLQVVGTLAAPAPVSPPVDFDIQQGTPTYQIKEAVPVVAAAPPATFTANPKIGPGGNTYKDSPHFRIYNYPSDAGATLALSVLEACYSCFVDDLGFRSSGLSYNSANDDGPWTKVNVYASGSLNAAGVMHSDYSTGMSWLEVHNNYLQGNEEPPAAVFSHEYGHGLTYAERNWVDQGRTGAWWETVGNWFQDLYKTSSLCQPARAKYGRSTTPTEINLRKSIGDSFQVIVDGSTDTGNYYQAWPFLTYMTYNLDQFAGLGTFTVRDMMRKYTRGSNETPLHSLARVATNSTVGQIVGRYWARMAYVDIGHPTAPALFLSQRGSINFANYDSSGTNTWKVKSARAPRYMGANITPLKKSGAVTANISVNANGAAYTATLSVRNTASSSVRYVKITDSGSAALAADEEATLVVANTPSTLITYDPFQLASSPANTGMSYTVTMTGATF